MPTDIIIRKLVLKVRTPNEAQALELRQNLSAGLQMGVIHLLDQVSRQMDLPAEQQVFQEKLELNLGSQKDLSADALLHLLHRELPEQLFKLVIQASGASGFATDDPEARRDDHAALLHYLEKGYLPWWHTSGANPLQLVQSIWDAKQEALWALLWAFCQRNPNHDVRRMVATVPAPLQQSFAEWLVNRSQDTDGILHSMLTNANLLAAAFTMPTDAVNSQLLQLLLQSHGDNHHVGKMLVGRLLHKHSAVFPDTIFLEKSFEQGRQIVAWMEELRAADNKVDMPTKTANGTVNADLLEGGAGVYVEDAGLILLHPFLPNLFTALGLLSANNQFSNEACQHKAVALLHCLVYGDAPVEEWKLVFAKILCGLKPDDFVEISTLIDEAARAECRTMMAAVVAYWDALKSASAEAMVATFVLRKGKLSWQGSHWLLQVERNVADILIDRLPWGIGVVRLPWLQHMIYTEW